MSTADHDLPPYQADNDQTEPNHCNTQHHSVQPQPKPAADTPIPLAVRRNGQRSIVLLMTAISITAFASGFWTSSLMHQERVRKDGQRRFGEFLLNADRLGIIDHQRLEEAVNAGTEDSAEDAAKKAKGGNQ